ncbi:MAG TPA: hypothetical protein DGT21_17740 [Armatimonadetes bacterium]|jgi:hypothetical protein|nr:hypothetical protein [Armatimonadota bacterium]
MARGVALLLAAVVALLAAGEACAEAGGSGEQRPSREQVREQLEQILAQPKYVQEEDLQVDPAWARPLETILRILARLFSRFTTASNALFASSPVVFWAIVGVLVITLIGIIAHIIWVVTRGLKDGSRPRGETATVLPRQSPAQLAAMAAEAAAAGDFNRAIVLLYLAAVTHLDRQGLIVYNRSDTNSQILRRLSGARELAELMAPLAGTVDAISYSSYRADLARFTAVETTVGRMLEYRRGTT